MKFRYEEIEKYFRETNETRVERPAGISFSLLAAFFGNSPYEANKLYRFSLNLSTFDGGPERN